MWGIRRRILTAFRECFGGVSRGVWWRFEDGLVAFREGFGGVSRVVWRRSEDGLTAFGKCSADNSSVFVAWIAHSYAIQCPTNRQPKGLQMFGDFEDWLRECDNCDKGQGVFCMVDWGRWRRWMIRIGKWHGSELIWWEALEYIRRASWSESEGCCVKTLNINVNNSSIIINII